MQRQVEEGGSRKVTVVNHQATHNEEGETLVKIDGMLEFHGTPKMGKRT
jgi:hypothetical protein